MPSQALCILFTNAHPSNIKSFRFEMLKFMVIRQDILVIVNLFYKSRTNPLTERIEIAFNFPSFFWYLFGFEDYSPRFYVAITAVDFSNHYIFLIKTFNNLKLKNNLRCFLNTKLTKQQLIFLYFSLVITAVNPIMNFDMGFFFYRLSKEISFQMNGFILITRTPLPLNFGVTTPLQEFLSFVWYNFFSNLVNPYNVE